MCSIINEEDEVIFDSPLKKYRVSSKMSNSMNRKMSWNNLKNNITSSNKSLESVQVSDGYYRNFSNLTDH